MDLLLLFALLLAVLAILILQILILRRPAPTVDLTSAERAIERVDRTLREELARSREEDSARASRAAQAQRDQLEIFGSGMSESLRTQAEQTRSLAQTTEQRLIDFREQVQALIGAEAATQRDQLQMFGAAMSESLRTQAEQTRSLAQTTEQRLIDFREQVQTLISAEASTQRDQLLLFGEQTRALSSTTEQRLDAVRTSLDTLFAQFREDVRLQTESAGQRLESVRGALDNQLGKLREENAQKLEQMRRTVDEQLQGTLEKRLGESFKLVSERLEQVYKGLGEMHTLAAEVGDVKRALSNVRTRGIWGEVGVRALLEETLAPDQFAENVAVTGGAERVEFAIKLPGQEGRPVWLPIDAKFPLEDYLRIVDAAEANNPAEVIIQSAKLEKSVRECARTVSLKYIQPPATTDFAILYLPTESLYAEVLRRPGLVEGLQRDFRITVTGPTTLGAFLNSLRMGFRTLAIQHQSSEVWKVLGEVKTEFGRYADVLAKVQKKLQEATNTVDTGLVRTRALEKKLRDVESLPAGEAEEEPEGFLFAASEN